jgi:hypothetical protein
VTAARWWRRRPVAGRMLLPAIVVAALLVALVPPGSAEAQTSDDEIDVRLTLSSLTGVLGPYSVTYDPDADDPTDRPEVPTDVELRVLVENAGPQALDALRVVVELYPAVGSRAELDVAFDGDPVGQPNVHDLLVHDGEPLGPGTIAGVSDALDDTGVFGDEGGVHPLRITAVRGAATLAQLTTAVIWLGAPVEDPLLTTVVWPIDDAPWRTVGGAYQAGADRAVQPGGRLDTLLRALERRPDDAPVVLAPAPHLVEDLRDRADGFVSIERQPDGSIETREVEPEDDDARLANDTLTRLRELARALPRAPITGPYADADLATLTAAGQTGLAAEAAVEGRRRLQQLLDRAPEASTHLVGGRLTPDVLDLLPGDQLLLPPAALTAAPPDVDGTRTLRPVRSTSGRLFTGIVANPAIAATLEAAPSRAGHVADVQRVLAESAFVYLNAPDVAGRSLVVLPPEAWDPSPELATSLLDGLASATWLRPTSPDVLTAAGSVGSDELSLAEPTEAPFPPTFVTALREAEASLDAARASVTPEAPAIGGRSSLALHDTLLRSTSRWYRQTDPTEAEALVRDVQRAVDDTFGEVEVATGTQVTLTSDAGQIPVTLQRTRGGPISVRVEVASQGRLVWPDGRRSEPLVLADGAAQTVSFRTRALSTGTFPVTVRVTDPTGTHELQRTTLSVRSTAISGAALSATGLAVLALLLAGALRRRRPSRRHHLEVVS